MTRQRLIAEQTYLGSLSEDQGVLASMTRMNIGLIQTQLTALEGDLRRLRNTAKLAAAEDTPPVALRDFEQRLDV